MPPPILLTVDDDPEVSRSLARDLRQQYGEEYRIRRAESGPAALDALKELKLRDEQVGLLLADQRMPGMTGVEFLEQSRNLYPKARRVLLTAYADTDAAIAAINQADVHYYLLKPWDPPQEKLYPVLDDLLEDWKVTGPAQVGRRGSGRRPSVVGPVARDQGLPDPQSGALQVAGARARPRSRPAARGPRWRRGAAPAARHRCRPGPAGPIDRRSGPHPRVGVGALASLLRPDRHRGRPRRPGRRRLRGVGRPAHGAGRAGGDRRAGRPELPDRELSRVSRPESAAAIWPEERPPRLAGSGRRCCWRPR